MIILGKWPYNTYFQPIWQNWCVRSLVTLRVSNDNFGEIIKEYLLLGWNRATWGADDYFGILGDSLNFWESKINRIIYDIETSINVPLNHCRRRFWRTFPSCFDIWSVMIHELMCWKDCNVNFSSFLSQSEISCNFPLELILYQIWHSIFLLKWFIWVSFAKNVYEKCVYIKHKIWGGHWGWTTGVQKCSISL